MNGEIQTPGEDWRNSVTSIMEMGRYLKIMKEALPTPDLTRMLRVNYNIDVSTAGKLITLSEHMILSDPENADRLPAAWGTLYEIAFLPNDILTKKLQNGGLQNHTKYDIWELRGVKFIDKTRVKRPKKEEQSYGGQVRISRDKSLVQHVKDGIANSPDGRGGPDLDVVAKQLKIGKNNYRKIRGLILLSYRPELTPEDRIMVQYLLDGVDKTRNIKSYYYQAKPLLERIWGPSKRNRLTEKGSKKVFETFRNAIRILCVTCDRVAEMEVPYMSAEDIEETINDLVGARKQIGKFAENLRRIKND